MSKQNLITLVTIDAIKVECLNAVYVMESKNKIARFKTNTEFILINYFDYNVLIQNRAVKNGTNFFHPFTILRLFFS